MSPAAPGVARGLAPESRPFPRAVQPGPARTVPRPTPGARPPDSLRPLLLGHGPAAQVAATLPLCVLAGGVRPIAVPRRPFLVASAETERLPREKEGSSPAARLSREIGTPSAAPLKGGGRSKQCPRERRGAEAPRRGMAAECAVGAVPRVLERHRAPPSPAPGSCGRAAPALSHTGARKEASPTGRPDPTPQPVREQLVSPRRARTR